MDEPGMSSKKLHISATIYATHFVLGCVVNFISPLVIEFAQKFDVSVSTISIVFTITTMAYLVSALTGGLVYNHVDRHVCVILLTVTISIAVFSLPHVSTIVPFYIFGGLIGFGAGGLDTAQIGWIIETWRNRAAPFILFQHFSFSIGTILPTLLLAPFLDKNGDNIKQMTSNNWTTSTELADYSYHDDEQKLGPKLKLLVPFTVGGGLMTIATILHLILFFRLKMTQKYQDDLTFSPLVSSEEDPLLDKDFGGGRMKPEKIRFTKTTAKLVALSCCIIGFYQAMEVTIFQFLPTYAVYSSIGLSEAAAAQILFGLSIAFACGRGLGILIVLRVPPQFILWTNFTIILTANLILLFVGQGSLIMMQVGSILLGFCGLSTVYPAFYAYIEKHVHVTNHIVAAITLSGGLVSSIYPLVVGNLIEDNPSVLNYVIFCSCAVLVVCFGTVHWLTSSRNRKLSLSSVKL